jgi:hypothetical protein
VIAGGTAATSRDTGDLEIARFAGGPVFGM